ncbi:PP2C family protein-serine/threonine phosphatase [Solimicrobium silvestre]|uniref:Serine/threonine protein phosphatase n=1 Tax=Solimicrobium silvestre TaxID=2099400 RepID=A0A2S9GUY7_9BURK|nr:protein phosphatase 2C domain-containing protein [Solimicrobium silvestre]PRC91466.1 Serine/threonine protein phosphatase [Solimicrobium silvestre]
MSQYKIEAGTGQHVGDRKEQQDRTALFAAPKAPGYMMAVLADGMGGKSGGALAAEQVIRTAKQLFEEFGPDDDVKAAIEAIVRESHTIIQLSGISAEKEPHSTIVILIITPHHHAVWAHIGDSRLYRFSGANLIERTIDHSYVEKLVSEKKITSEEAKSHTLSNILVNVLGSSSTEPFITFNEYDGLKPTDSFLLCSDGLWHYFTDRELGAVISANTPRIASEMLINKARERASGRGDNCTMAIVKLIKPAKVEKGYTVEKMRRAV